MTPVFAVVLLAAKKFWILDPLYSALGTLLAWFYSVVPSYAGAIVLLTLVVRLATFPLTAKQARSQQDLQRLQPELKRLQAKYKNDKQKLNEEMMKFYKENHVNPFGGCLPLVVQFPVLIVLYRLILGLTHKPPQHIPTSSSMYQALRESGGKMMSWGMDLAQKASAVKGSKQAPFLILVVLVVATGYFQQRQLTARLPKESANSQMAMMGKVFPVVFGLISFSIPAGVVVYFLVSNIWQIGQQALIFRHQPPPGTDKGAKDVKEKEGPGAPAKGGKGAGSAKKGVPTPKRTPGAKAGPKSAAKGKQARGKAPKAPKAPKGPAGATTKGGKGTPPAGSSGRAKRGVIGDGEAVGGNGPAANGGVGRKRRGKGASPSASKTESGNGTAKSKKSTRPPTTGDGARPKTGEGQSNPPGGPAPVGDAQKDDE